MDISKWKEMIQKERGEKDRFFSSYYESPIPLEDATGAGDFTIILLTRITDLKSNFTNMGRRKS